MLSVDRNNSQMLNSSDDFSSTVLALPARKVCWSEVSTPGGGEDTTSKVGSGIETDAWPVWVFATVLPAWSTLWCLLSED